MDTTTPIENLLQNIAELLASHGEEKWAKSFHGFAGEFQESPAETKGRIRSVYGGMGSFNDIILHSADGIPLREENNELDQMRSDLFKMCQE